MIRRYTIVLLLLSVGARAYGEDKAFVGVRFSVDSPRVDHVFPGAPAEKAGLAIGDVVLKFGDDEVTSTEQLQTLIQSQKPGDKAIFTVERKGEKLELTATLARRTVRWFLEQDDPPRMPGGTVQLSGGGIGGDFHQSGNFVVEGASTIDGNFKQEWSGILDMRVTASDPPLRVAGDMHLAGMLHIRLADGVKPKLGERFKIIAGARSIEGKFDELSLPDLGEKLGWRVEYDNIEKMDDFDDDGLHDVTLLVVDPDKEMPPVEP